MAKNKYVDIWRKVLPSIIEILDDDDDSGDSFGRLHLPEELFRSVGNRKNYNFSLEYCGFEQLRNLSGSAVARDLDLVLRESKEFTDITIWHRVEIMFHDFTLSVLKHHHVLI